jgi:hypothetical protein
MRTLETKLQAAPKLTTRGGYEVSVPGGGDEILIQLGGSEVMRITLGTMMKIKTTDNLSLEAPNITLRADNSIKIESGAAMDLKSGSVMTLKSASNLNAQSSGIVSINNGALEVT